MSKEFNKQEDFNKSDDINFIQEIRSMSQKALDEWGNIFQTHAHMDDKIRLSEAISSIKYMIKSAASSGLCSILLLLPNVAERHNWDMEEWDPPLSPKLATHHGFPHILNGLRVPPRIGVSLNPLDPNITWLTDDLGRRQKNRPNRLADKRFTLLIVKELRQLGFTFTRIKNQDYNFPESTTIAQSPKGFIAPSSTKHQSKKYQTISVWSISWGEGNGE